MRRARGAAKGARRPHARRSGFGMIELLLVMVIIGILCAIAIPMYVGQRERARNAAAREGGRTIALAALSYVTVSEDDAWPALCDQATLSAWLPADEWPENPFSGAPMAQVDASADGDYTYRAVPDADGYRLRVYLHGTAPFLVL